MSIETISSIIALNKISQEVGLHNCTFLVGAGISSLPPSPLPNGKELKELIVNNILDLPEFELEIIKLNRNPKFLNIVPEVLFQEVYSVIGNRIFEIYNLLSLSNPNELHYLLAHISNQYGAKIFTTNFDLLIDQFLINIKQINHLHGSLNKPTEMVILINQVGKGINKKYKLDFLANTDNKTLVVLGYSGNDNDIIELINQSQVKEVIWLLRDLKEEWTLKNIKRLIGIKCLLFSMELTEFLLELKKSFDPGAFIRLLTDFGNQKQLIIESFKIGLSQFEKYFILQLIFFSIEDYKSALSICESLIKTNKTLTLAQQSDILASQSDLIRIIGSNFPYAHRVINRHLRISGIIPTQYSFGRLNNVKGLLFLEGTQSKPRRSLPYFEAAIKCYKYRLKREKNLIIREKLYISLSKAYNNWGLALDTLKDFYKAIEIYKKSLKLKRKQGNLLSLSVTQVNLCLTFLKVGDNKTSSYWERKSLKIIMKYDDFYRAAFLKRQKGFILAKVDKKNSITFLREALEIYYKHIPDASLDIKLTMERIAYVEGLK